MNKPAKRAGIFSNACREGPGIRFPKLDGGLAEAQRHDAEMDVNPALGLSLAEFDQKILSRRTW
jgi:hypothetical protein